MRNYDTIIKAINDILTRMYKAMNDYLENILNAPSTIISLATLFITLEISEVISETLITTLSLNSLFNAFSILVKIKTSLN